MFALTDRAAILVGQDERDLCDAADAEWLTTRVHREVVEPFRALRDAARAQGFEIAIDSGFRSFDRQLSIWNRKTGGELAVLDSQARPLDIATLTGRELAFAILRWSALPGASRHHWGTDLDIYDATAAPPGYEVELIPAEVESGGIFSPLHEWLDKRIADGRSFGFFRPYDRDRGGIAPERWHLSYAPIAVPNARLLTADLLRQAIEPAGMMLKDIVLGNLDEIMVRFVTNTNPDSP